MTPSREPDAKCPLCGERRRRRVLRGSDRFLRCAACGVVYNTEYSPLSYDGGYFTTDYLAQYGRTYEDDFDRIYAISLKRLERAWALSGRKNDRSGMRILDLGCAFGFFLKAAMDLGYGHVEGVEVSEFGAAYCRERFGITVRNAPFEQASFEGRYDIISAWYFIEHCADPSFALERIPSLLNPGGIFCFSAPSIFGPQFMLHRDEWASSHPADHRIDFSPRSAVRTLRRRGFSKVQVYPGGIHPERALSPQSRWFGAFSTLYGALSRACAFSDTMEAYARFDGQAG